MLCDATNCTKCGACISKCPENCIQFIQNKDGFSYPVIREKDCVRCGLCEEACPVLYPYSREGFCFPEVYLAHSKDADVLQQSTSGGIASELNRFFTRDLDGFACGVQNGQDYIPHFVLLDRTSDVSAVSGSKYVHSMTDDIYTKVKKCLNEGRHVFFCGLPCQVAGLYSFLGKDNEHLITADIVCHGCTEEKFYKSYVDYLQKNHGNNIVSIEHTSKKRAWSILIQRLVRIQMKDGSEKLLWSQEDPYLDMFLNGFFFRPACYQCPFAHLPRVGDLTLGDFFGIGTICPANYLEKQGESMVMVNTEKGKQCYEKLSKYIISEKRELEEAVYYNHNLWTASKKNRLHDAFISDAAMMSWEQLITKYYDSKSAKRWRIIRKMTKTIIGKKKTAQLMLSTYRKQKTIEKADNMIADLKNQFRNGEDNS